MAHGNADRLLAADQTDLGRLDATVGAGGANVDGEHLGFVNDALGPQLFGRMFPALQPFRPPDEGLIALGTSGSSAGGGPTNMEEPLPSPDNSAIPAGFTYFGQFVDHDLTLDPTVGFPFIPDARRLRDARTPAFDLDSLYGLGPKLQPELYDPAFPASRARMAIGSTNPTPSIAGRGNLPTIPGSLPNDLPRHADLTAIIGDRRNDENLIVAQLHLAFLKFHNAVIGRLPDADDAFEEAKRLVTWHYQWIVLNDFLPRIVDPAVRDDVLKNGRKLFEFDDRPFMPIEFSAAAYRLGHSMVREQYNYNRVFNAVVPTALVPATLDFLFDFTGAGGFQPTSTPDPHAVLSGIPSNWVIDWRRFFEVTSDSVAGKLLNVARAIDTKITHFLFSLRVPGVVAALPTSLPERNLLRGSRLGLPTGQDVAQAIGVTALQPDELATGATGAVIRQFGFDTRTPLWFYILKEAEVVAKGQRLGPVGSRIVSEVFVGLLDGDENSFRRKQPDWKPTLAARQPGDFTMADLLLFVNDLNPIGPDLGGK
jgi:Animal haem peroxidase